MNTTQPIRNPEHLRLFKLYYKEVNPNPRNYSLIITGLNTALRINDILNIRWGDIYDFEKKSFKEHLDITEQKTGKKNLILLNPQLLEALSAYLLPENTASDFLFCGRFGDKPLCRQQAFRIIKEAAHYAGEEEHISCHSLRKTFGYYAWKQGVPAVILMNIFNHSSFRITKRYLGIEQDDKDSVFLNIRI